MLILKAVSLKPLHGYGVLLRIRQISGDALEIPQGSLYPALYRLEHQGLIAAEWGQSDNNRRAKYYTLTAGRTPPPARGDGRLEPAGVRDRRGLEHRRRRRCDDVEALRSPVPCAPPPARFRRRHGRGAALPHRAIHGRPRALRRARRRKRRAARAWSSAASTASRRTAARRAGFACSMSFGRELRYAARLLRKTPGFTATALVTLALCLGANLTIFAVVDSILLRPLPFPDAGRLVTVFNTYPKAGVDRDGSSLTNYYERRGRIPAFVGARDLPLRHGDRRRDRRNGARAGHAGVSGLFLHPGARPGDGARLHGGGDHVSNGRVAILTDAYWRQHFNADPHVIGRADSRGRTSRGPWSASCRPASASSRPRRGSTSRSRRARKIARPRQRHSGGNVTQMIARLKPGATLAQAQAQIDAQNAALEADDPEAKMMADAGFRSLVVPLHADHVAAIRPTLLLMQAGALVPSPDRRGQSREPASHPRQRPGEGTGRPAGAGREPAARRERSDGRDHAAHAGRRAARARPSERAESACWPRWAPTPALGKSHIAFDARLAWSPWRGASSWGSRSALPIAWFNLRSAIWPRAAIRVPRRNGRPRRATAAPRLHRRPDRPGLRAARGGGPARAQPQAGDGRLSRLPARPRSERTDLLPWNELSGRGRPCSHSPRG